jgi:hypothetical protein
MIKVNIVVENNSLEIESDTATIPEVMPIITLWFAAITDIPNEEKGKIEFKIHPTEEQ